MMMMCYQEGHGMKMVFGGVLAGNRIITGYAAEHRKSGPEKKRPGKSRQNVKNEIITYIYC